jgi:hypothetical protein
VSCLTLDRYYFAAGSPSAREGASVIGYRLAWQQYGRCALLSRRLIYQASILHRLKGSLALHSSSNNGNRGRNWAVPEHVRKAHHGQEKRTRASTALLRLSDRTYVVTSRLMRRPSGTGACMHTCTSPDTVVSYHTPECLHAKRSGTGWVSHLIHFLVGELS